MQLQQFAEQGFLIFDPEIKNVDDIAADLRDNVPYPIREVKPFNRVQDHWRHNTSVRQLACLPKVLPIGYAATRESGECRIITSG